MDTRAPDGPSLPAAPSRGRYAAMMAGVTALGVAAAAVAALGLGGDGRVALLAGAAVLVGSAATFAPALLGGRAAAMYWGVAVVGASMGRMLVTLGMGVVLVQTRDLAKQPFWGGIVAGVLVILVIESVIAVKTLSRMQKQQQQRRMNSERA